VWLTTLPPVLNIHINRCGFDIQTMQRHKVGLATRPFHSLTTPAVRAIGVSSQVGHEELFGSGHPLTIARLPALHVTPFPHPPFLLGFFFSPFCLLQKLKKNNKQTNKQILRLRLSGGICLLF
jgi:hypothetical protein